MNYEQSDEFWNGLMPRDRRYKNPIQKFSIQLDRKYERLVDKEMKRFVKTPTDYISCETFWGWSHVKSRFGLAEFKRPKSAEGADIIICCKESARLD